MLVINKIEAHYIVNQSVTLRKVMLEAKHYSRNVYIYRTSLLRKSQGLNLNAGSETLCSHAIKCENLKLVNSKNGWLN